MTASFAECYYRIFCGYLVLFNNLFGFAKRKASTGRKILKLIDTLYHIYMPLFLLFILIEFLKQNNY